jgi:uncharacterized protein
VLRILTIALLVPVAAYAADTASKDLRLVQAIKSGDTAAAISLVQAKADVNVAEPDGTTPLHWAVRNDDATLIDRLLRAGANATAENRYGITPIHLACTNGSAPAVERLLKAGVSANATGPLGETALMTCARTGKVDAAKALIARGAVVDARESWRGQTALMWAAAQGHPEMIRALVQAGADVNNRSAVMEWARQRSFEPRDKWLPLGGLTPLHYAAREGCTDCIRTLVSLGADINSIDADRITPLISALINGHFDVAGALIQLGADLTLADKVGRTALYAAVDGHTVPASNRPAPRETDDELGSFDIVKLLVDKGAPVNAALREQTPYRTKLDRGGDGVLGAGTTPLLRAAKAGDVPVVKLLLENGANARATTRNGVTAIAMAANVAAREEDMTGRAKTQKMAIETIRLLLAAGGDVNAVDNQGRTPAHGAALWGLTDVIKFLGQSGAQMNAPDKRGFTPLDVALGRAGGFGFDGRAGVVREETAKALRELGGTEGTPVAPSQRGPSGRPDPADDNN